jgi:hypothetical protein
MNRRGFLSAIGALVGGLAIEQAIPLGRVWSFPSKIVIPPPVMGPRLFLSKDGRAFTEIPGLKAVSLEPSVVDLDEVTNLDSEGIFNEWLPALLGKDHITFAGQGVDGLIAGTSLDELRRFRVELDDGMKCEGGIQIGQVDLSANEYRIRGAVTSVFMDELINGSTDPEVIAREREIGALARGFGRSPIQLTA